jgi:hypothetical protein
VLVEPDIGARQVAHNMLLTAHGWALKHWNPELSTTVEN